MTSVFLYGELRNKFGEEFSFKINSPKEAFAAINANRRGFLNEIKKLASKGVMYRIVIDDKVAEDKSDVVVKKVPKEMHIVPVVWGAGGNAGTILMVVAMIALVVVTGGTAALGGPAAMGMFTAGTATAAAGSLAAYAGVVGAIAGAIAIQGIMSLLYPPPKPDFNQEVQAGGKSYLFGNKQNNASQGQAVAVGYGRLLVGSSQISSSNSHYALKTDMRALMTPTDQPINDYMELEFTDESQRYVQDSFYTNQSSSFDDSPSFSSINILNSYINILTKSAETVTSSLVESVVKTNDVVVSNPNLTSSFNEEVSFSWIDLTAVANAGKIKIENPYSFDEGVAYRLYKASDFALTSQLDVANTNASYFTTYSSNQLVSFGPSQFQNLNFHTWDQNIEYVSGELIVHDNVFYRAKTATVLDATDFTGSAPTETAFWEVLTAPANEQTYKCLANSTKGYLPTDTAQWSAIVAPTSSGEMNSLTNFFGEPLKENIFIGDLDTLNPPTIDQGGQFVENSLMEFLGYFFVDKSRDLEIDAIDAVNGTIYEITKVGNSNWSAIGSYASPAIGTTFTKNSTAATGTGKVHPVANYRFILDCDDSADLFVDGQLAAFHYGTGGLTLTTPENTNENTINSLSTSKLTGTANPTASTTLVGSGTLFTTELVVGDGITINNETRTVTAIASNTSLTVDTAFTDTASASITKLKTLKLTTGYHKIYARVYNKSGGSGLSLYYKYDRNLDGVFSNWSIVSKDLVKHQKLNDIYIPKNLKFLSKITAATLGTAYFVIGKKYKIINLGDVNWSSIGASSPEVGSVFVKNSTAATGTGSAFSETYSYKEATSAASNRIMRFVAQRPTDATNQTAIYRASFQCLARFSDAEVTLRSSPVTVNIKFLPVATNFEGVAARTVLPIVPDGAQIV